MDRLSTILVYVLVGFPIFFVAIFLLSFGPLGLFLFVFLILIIMAILSWNDPDEPPARTNCSKCGAPNELDRDRCKHCNSSLETTDSN